MKLTITLWMALPAFPNISSACPTTLLATKSQFAKQLLPRDKWPETHHDERNDAVPYWDLVPPPQEKRASSAATRVPYCERYRRTVMAAYLIRTRDLRRMRREQLFSHKHF